MSGCLPGLRRVRHNICQQQRGAKRWPTASRQAKAFQCSAPFLFVCVSASPPVSSRQHSRFCQNWVQELHWLERALKEEKALLKVSLCISIRVVIWNFLSVSLSLCGGQINHISKGKRSLCTFAGAFHRRCSLPSFPPVCRHSHLARVAAARARRRAEGYK